MAAYRELDSNEIMDFDGIKDPICALVPEDFDLEDEAVESVTVGIVDYETDPSNPNDWGGSTVKLFGRHYNDPTEADLAALGLIEYEDDEDAVEADPYARQISMYDHSGITIWRTGAPHGYCQHGAWDTSPLGGIWTAGDDLREMFDAAAAAIAKDGFATWGDAKYTEIAALVDHVADSEIGTYDDYVTGNVFWYRIVKFVRNEDGCFVEDEEGDSCGDIYGLDYVKSEAAAGF